MSRNVKISAALVVLFAGIVLALALMSGGEDDGDQQADAPAAAQTTTGETSADASGEPAPLPRVVNEDPRRLGKSGRDGVTFTEFLDFECEACGAAYPAIEQLREQYAGRVTFNVRYFPLPGHKNSRNAAFAVEAAAQQGKLEPMYRKMFETQEEWGEQSDSQAALFREFAEEIGLDMEQYDRAVVHPKTAQRVEADFTDAVALGLQGTPAFFIDEQRIEPQSIDDLNVELDNALSGE